MGRKRCRQRPTGRDSTGKDKSVPESAAVYFPPPESKGGWRKLEDPQDIRRLGGMDPAKLGELKQWLLGSDDRPFAAVVIRNGYIVLEVERDHSSATNTENVKSCAKAICATVLAIASEESQQGHLPRRMSFDDPAFDYIPWAQPLSDPRKAQIKVKQLLNHTSGITPEGYGIANHQKWEYILGHGGDGRTAKLFFDPGTTLEYSTHALLPRRAGLRKRHRAKATTNTPSRRCSSRWASRSGGSRSSRETKSTEAMLRTRLGCRRGRWPALPIACCAMGAGVIAR